MLVKGATWVKYQSGPQATSVEFNGAIISFHKFVWTLCLKMAYVWRHQAITWADVL